MTYKLTCEAIDEMVDKAKAQANLMIERTIRQVVRDFENAESDGFKLALTIEGERKASDAMMTIQTKAQSTVDIKRKDQTSAEIIDWGPTLFDKSEGEDIPAPEDEEEARGPKLLCSASPVFDGTVVDAEFTVTDGESAPSPADGDEPQDAPPEAAAGDDPDPEAVPEEDEPAEEPADEQPIED